MILRWERFQYTILSFVFPYQYFNGQQQEGRQADVLPATVEIDLFVEARQAT